MRAAATQFLKAESVAGPSKDPRPPKKRRRRTSDGDDDVPVPVEETIEECVICLDVKTDRSIVLPCMHDYCYECITKWVRINPDCPLCKRAAVSIIHSILSDGNFQEDKVTNFRRPPAFFSNIQMPIGMHNFNRDMLRENLLRIFANTGTLAPRDTRALVYLVNLRTILPNVPDRIRETSPEFLSRNAVARHRLGEYALRDLAAMQLRDYNAIYERLNSLVVTYAIESPQLVTALEQSSLRQRAGAFLSELALYANYPSSIPQFDASVELITPEQVVVYRSSCGIVASDVLVERILNLTIFSQAHSQRTYSLISRFIGIGSEGPSIIAVMSRLMNGLREPVLDHNYSATRRSLYPLGMFPSPFGIGPMPSQFSAMGLFAPVIRDRVEPTLTVYNETYHAPDALRRPPVAIPSDSPASATHPGNDHGLRRSPSPRQSDDDWHFLRRPALFDDPTTEYFNRRNYDRQLRQRRQPAQSIIPNFLIDPPSPVPPDIRSSPPMRYSPLAVEVGLRGLSSYTTVEHDHYADDISNEGHPGVSIPSANNPLSSDISIQGSISVRIASPDVSRSSSPSSIGDDCVIIDQTTPRRETIVISSASSDEDATVHVRLSRAPVLHPREAYIRRERFTRRRMMLMNKIRNSRRSSGHSDSRTSSPPQKVRVAEKRIPSSSPNGSDSSLSRTERPHKSKKHKHFKKQWVDKSTKSSKRDERELIKSEVDESDESSSVASHKRMKSVIGQVFGEYVSFPSIEEAVSTPPERIFSTDEETSGEIELIPSVITKKRRKKISLISRHAEDSGDTDSTLENGASDNSSTSVSGMCPTIPKGVSISSEPVEGDGECPIVISDSDDDVNSILNPLVNIYEPLTEDDFYRYLTYPVASPE